LRSNPDSSASHELGKLFTESPEEAAKFAKQSFQLDKTSGLEGEAKFIIGVDLPEEVAKKYLTLMLKYQFLQFQMKFLIKYL